MRICGDLSSSSKGYHCKCEKCKKIFTGKSESVKIRSDFGSQASLGLLMCPNKQPHPLFLLEYFYHPSKIFLRLDFLFLRILFSNVTMFGFATILYAVKVLCVQNSCSNIETVQHELKTGRKFVCGNC